MSVVLAPYETVLSQQNDDYRRETWTSVIGKLDISDGWRIKRTLYKISFLYVSIQFFIVIIKQISIMSAFERKLK